MVSEGKTVKALDLIVESRIAGYRCYFWKSARLPLEYPVTVLRRDTDIPDFLWQLWLGNCNPVLNEHLRYVRVGP
jgi:hypothetical protein